MVRLKAKLISDVVQASPLVKSDILLLILCKKPAARHFKHVSSFRC